MVRIEENGIVGEGETRKEAEKALRLAKKEEAKAKAERETRFAETQAEHYRNVGEIVCRSLTNLWFDKNITIDLTLGYQQSVTCFIRNTNTGIPVMARVSDSDGTYYWQSLVQVKARNGQFLHWDNADLSDSHPIRSALLNAVEAYYQTWVQNEASLAA